MTARKQPIVIELPLPPDCLHPNARPHRWAKMKATKATRELACLVARTARPDAPFAKACYRITFRLSRRRDYDGLLSWAKATIDGIADAGVIVNDAHFRPLEIVRLSGQKETGGKTGITFEIWEETAT
jgi:hypothetical protein